MKFGEKLQELRFSLKMTQSEMAEELQISEETLKNWEDGIGEPSLSTLGKLISMGFDVEEAVKEEKDSDEDTIPFLPELEKSKRYLIINLVSISLLAFLLVLLLIVLSLTEAKSTTESVLRILLPSLIIGPAILWRTVSLIRYASKPNPILILGKDGIKVEGKFYSYSRIREFSFRKYHSLRRYGFEIPSGTLYVVLTDDTKLKVPYLDQVEQVYNVVSKLVKR